MAEIHVQPKKHPVNTNWIWIVLVLLIAAAVAIYFFSRNNANVVTDEKTNTTSYNQWIKPVEGGLYGQVAA